MREVAVNGSDKMGLCRNLMGDRSQISNRGSQMIVNNRMVPTLLVGYSVTKLNDCSAVLDGTGTDMGPKAGD